MPFLHDICFIAKQYRVRARKIFIYRVFRSTYLPIHLVVTFVFTLLSSRRKIARTRVLSVSLAIIIRVSLNFSTIYTSSRLHGSRSPSRENCFSMTHTVGKIRPRRFSGHRVRFLLFFFSLPFFSLSCRSQRSDFNVEKGAAAAQHAPTDSSVMDLTSLGRSRTRLLTSADTFRRILVSQLALFLSRSLLLTLPLLFSLCQSLSLSLRTHASLSRILPFSICLSPPLCLPFPLTPHGVNIYVLIAPYTARRTLKRENSVSPRV